MGKGQRKSSNISLQDIITADTKHVKYHVNIERLENNLQNYSSDQNFQKIAKTLLQYHRAKKIDAKNYVFSPDVFEVLRHHWKKRKN